jgi:hypothetical protein
LILKPFDDELPIPKALRPCPQSDYTSWARTPGPGFDQQNSMRNQQHQIWPSQINYPDPIVYKIDVLLRQHAFTTSQVLPIDSKGKPTVSFDPSGKPLAAGAIRSLPLSTIYGFNGTFPGPRINAEYGKPVLVRFENHLDENPLNLDRQDFGSPDWSSRPTCTTATRRRRATATRTTQCGTGLRRTATSRRRSWTTST